MNQRLIILECDIDGKAKIDECMTEIQRLSTTIRLTLKGMVEEVSDCEDFQ